MKDNRGLTFVELIVAMVVFGIIAAAALGFLVASSRTYGSVNGAMNQNLSAELAVNQIAEYLIDCDGRVSFLDDTLIITDANDAGVVTTYVFEKDEDVINFGSAVGAATAPTADALLLKNVKAFSVSFVAGNATNADSAKITIVTESRGREMTTEKSIALRNKPIK